MGKLDEKRRRKQAHRDEIRRRELERENASPLSRQQLHALLDELANQIVPHGHDGSFALTIDWLRQHGLPVENTVAFFRGLDMQCDFDVAIGADPNKLFGASATHRARMPMDRVALEALLDWLELELETNSCDDSRRMTRRWLQERGLPEFPIEMALLALGGGCDCEIVLNVVTEDIFVDEV